MKVQDLPEWFPSVPIFEQDDPSFFLLGYFSGRDDETDLSAEFTTKKYVADSCENYDIEFICENRGFWILFDWSKQVILVSDQLEGKAWESTPINFNLLLDGSRTSNELPDTFVVVDFAQKFITALLATTAVPSPGQLQLEFANVRCE
jgi:hypothetical protein